MHVSKRSGFKELISFDKILKRIQSVGHKAGIHHINYTALAMKVIDQLYDGIPTTKIDELTCEQCAALSSNHPDYGVLAAHIYVNNLHKNTEASLLTVVDKLYHFYDVQGEHAPMITEDLYKTVQEHDVELQAMLEFERDYTFDYFGLKTLERAYLFRVKGKIVERPQHMWLRVALGIHGTDLAAVKETYDLMSQKYFTHATPTLFNAGTVRPQLSSCFLLAMEDDSLDGIFNTLKDCAMISKWAGGIGLHIHNVRCKGSHICGTNGSSNGIIPMLRVFNNTARYVDQCVVPTTVLYTADRGPIEIRNCVAGETVVFNKTSGGEEVVAKVLEYAHNGPIYKIQTAYDMEPMQITDQHPILSLNVEEDLVDVGGSGFIKAPTVDELITMMNYGFKSLEWTEACKVTENHYIAYSVPDHVNDYLDFKKADCLMYGLIMQTGEIQMRGHGDIMYSVYDVELHSKTMKDIFEYLNQRFIPYKTEIDGFKRQVQIKWKHSNDLAFRIHDFYDDYGCKRLQNRWLHLPVVKTRAILRGLLQCSAKTYLEKRHDVQYVRLSLASQMFLESVRFLFLRCGYLVGGDKQTKSIILEETLWDAILDCKDDELLQTYYVQRNQDCFRYENMIFAAVSNVSVENYSGQVYDLQMTTEHNYLLSNGIVHNGGGKRNGSFAIYLETWHGDIEDFLELKKNHGDEDMRARDLFLGLWISDLFMERVHENKTWSLFCPHECSRLSETYGDEFKALYETYEREGKARKTVQARDLWFRILDAQMETGTPYLLFKDTCNRRSNQKNVGMIKSSNLCVAPETKILTDSGFLEIQTLEGQKVNVWNGEEYSEVTVFKTGENQELMEVETSDGCVLTCTPYHKFYVQHKYLKTKIIDGEQMTSVTEHIENGKKNIELVEAKDLKEGDKLIKCDYPIIDGRESMKYSYTHGFFCGDGTYNKNNGQEKKSCNFKALINHSYCKRHMDYEDVINNELPVQTTDTDIKCNAFSYVKKPMVSLYGDKKKLLSFLDYRTVGKEDSKGRLNVNLPVDIEEKFYVPMNCSLQNKMDWFSGYSDADGCICKNGTNQQLQINSIEKDFLFQVKLMLQTCGINPKMKLAKVKRLEMLPDSNGNYKEYLCEPLYRLLVTSYDLQKLVKLGYSPKRLIINNNIPNRNASQFIKIKKITFTGRKDTTYCFTEPKKHAGIFNGMITSQCAEIIEYSDEKETAVCNLGSIALPAFVDPVSREFNYAKLHEVTKVLTTNLNRIIDVNYYPTEKTRRSNMRHRPIGIGVQGLADTFILMDIAFVSEEAKEVNKLIFETMYHAALERSNELSIERFDLLVESYKTSKICGNHSGIIDSLLNEYENEAFAEPCEHIGAYSTFIGSPLSQGQFQFDLAGVEPTPGRYNWDILRESIKLFGVRNSLLVALMPTASTSQILGYNECFEPLTSNLYTRRTLAGEFVVANKYLMRELIDLGLWNESVKNNMIANKGSIQQMTHLPEKLREKYRIVWEMPMKHLIDMSADRGAFVCQSQSLNLWMEEPVYSKLTSMHFYSWKRGLKTGIYYLRRKAKHQAQQFTVEPEQQKGVQVKDDDEEGSKEYPACENCSA
jgi:ribonucleoside-diphosphate reductase alpha chain